MVLDETLEMDDDQRSGVTPAFSRSGSASASR